MNKRVWLSLSILFVVVLCVFAILRTQEGKYVKEPYVKEKVLLDTLVTIKAYGPNNAQVEETVNKAMREIQKIDQMMNFYDPQSEISKINKSAGKKRRASQDLTSVIAISKGYSKKTGGAFDITIGPLIRLWNFNGKPKVPSEKELRKALSLVNIENVEINKEKNTVSLKKPGMELDLGGVAKGYAVDKAITVLKKNGIKRALVTTGSTTTVIGSKPGNRHWLIGIEHPRKENETIGIVKLANKSISTSGDYQRCFIKNGKRYHHILDPKTGLPARGCRSATIITSKSCTEADILSTAIFVMGYPKGMEFLKQIEDAEGVIVDSKGKVHVSPGLRGRIGGLENDARF